LIGDQSGQEKFFFYKNNVFYETQIGEMVHYVNVVNFDLFIVSYVVLLYVSSSSSKSQKLKI